ncbi:uncharacterized protein KZ484_023731 [Pholidichthys leucotaenia]
MDTLQVSLACQLLMAISGVTALTGDCPICPPGYFLVGNCSSIANVHEGIQCKDCTKCSDQNLETLVKCSSTANSVCGTQTTTTMANTSAEPSVLSSEILVCISVIILSSILILLLCLIVLLLSRHYQKHKEVYLA